MNSGRNLVEIPFVDASQSGAPDTARAETSRLSAIVTSGRRHYGKLAVVAGDLISKAWLRRQESEYIPEVAAVADEVGVGGAWLLNLSYEWSCTTGAGPDPSGVGNRMLRTLDWPLEGLGETVVVAKFKGNAGHYFNVTWPGAVGIVTAMAPGRFSAAINQPPFRKWTQSCWADWPINRIRLLKSTAPPPTFLLRKVFDTCATYDEAKEVLCEHPIAMPAFFTLSGTSPNQACLIEREETGASVHDSPTACANHWMKRTVPGHGRGFDSHGRLALLQETRDSASDDFDWVQPPILNETTRLAVVANAQQGKLMVCGYEDCEPVTLAYHLPPPA